MSSELSKLSAEACFTAALLFASVGIIIDTLEYLTLIPQFGDNGVFSWKVFAVRIKPGRLKISRVINESLFNPSGVKRLLVTRLFVIALLFVPNLSHVYYFTCICLLLTLCLLVNYRCIYGNDGSGQMQVVVLAGLLVYLLLTITNASWSTLGFWFVALQSSLSYFSAGLSKLLSPAWRNGEAIYRIFNTATYGSKSVARVLQGRPRVQRFLCWSVISFECLFPCCLFLPRSLILPILAVGVAFHIGNAVIMGLNTFLWSFLATYPIILFCNNQFTTVTNGY